MRNMTERRIPAHPSNTYPFTLAADLQGIPMLLNETVRAQVIIDGKTFLMQRKRGLPDLFTYRHRFPSYVKRVPYYYILDYKIRRDGHIRQRQYTSPLYALEFLQQEPDVLPIDEIQADLDATTLPGPFSRMTILPSSLSLTSGQKEELTFSISLPAPEGGLVIEVMTDIPNSVIMPEILIPEGESSVTISIEGGVDGSGTLFVLAPGFEAITVPVKVSTLEESI